MPGDEVIIAAYASMTEEEADEFSPTVVMVNKDNSIKSVKNKEIDH